MNRQMKTLPIPSYCPARYRCSYGNGVSKLWTLPLSCPATAEMEGQDGKEKSFGWSRERLMRNPLDLICEGSCVIWLLSHVLWQPKREAWAH